MAPGILVNGDGAHAPNDYPSKRKLNAHDDVHFDPKLQPKRYTIAGTRPDSKILFVDVNILDSTGADPYPGDVYIEGERIEWSWGCTHTFYVEQWRSW